MAKRLIEILSSIVLVAILALAHNSGLKPEGQVGPVAGKPLSAIEERHSEEIMNDGSRQDHPSSGLFYRDEQGRMRIESTTKAVIYDPVAGFMYVTDAKTKTYRKISVQAANPISIVVIEDGIWISSEASRKPSTASAAAVPGALPASGEGGQRVVNEDLATTTIGSMRVHGTRLTSTIPAGTVGNDHDLKTVNERWYSDEVKVLVRSSRSDPRFGSLRYELTNISQTAPDPALFQVPAGFTLLAEKK